LGLFVSLHNADTFWNKFDLVDMGACVMRNHKRAECYSCIYSVRTIGNYYLGCNKPDKKMTGSPYGVMKGWFDYPTLFDPLWKEDYCVNYVEKPAKEEEQKDGKSMQTL